MRKLVGDLVAVFGLLVFFLPFWPDENADAQEKKPTAGAVEVKNDEDQNGAIEKFMTSFSEPIEIRESNPARFHDAEFVAVAQTNWKAAKRDKQFPKASALDVQLRVTNFGKGALLFPAQIFGVKLANAYGQEVKPRKSRHGTFATRPFLLPAGISYAWGARVELHQGDKDVPELVFVDGAGSEFLFGPLPPGRYNLALSYSGARLDPKMKSCPAGASAWAGEAATQQVAVEVADNLTRGHLPESALRIGAFKDPIQIQESKPVTVNGAKFVVVGQTNWEIEKPGQAAPIEIQLRVTNTTKEPMLLRTFDAIYWKLTDANGNSVSAKGGRSATRFTAPILLSAGASYSFCRGHTKGERYTGLFCDEKSLESKVSYLDGTGLGLGYGPLETGRYKLAYVYSVRPNSRKMKVGDPVTWSGEAATDDLAVEFTKR